MNMLSFYVVRGVKPEYLLSLSPLERRFYYNSMEMYYSELNVILNLLIGGGRRG